MNRVLQQRLTALLDGDGERLYAALNRLTWPHAVAADLFQELFVRLGRSPGFVTADDPSAYAWRAAMNLATEWRRRHRDDPDEFREASDSATDDPSPLDRLIRHEETAQILDSLCDLTDLARECFVRRWIETESYESIALAMGKTPQQVRGMCHAAMRQLRARLAPAVGDTAQAKVAKTDA